MLRSVKSPPWIVLALALAAAGCGGNTAAVTDPSQLPPVTEAERKAVRLEDDQIASEENSNPVQAVKRRPSGR